MLNVECVQPNFPLTLYIYPKVVECNRISHIFLKISSLCAMRLDINDEQNLIIDISILALLFVRNFNFSSSTNIIILISSTSIFFRSF